MIFEEGTLARAGTSELGPLAIFPTLYSGVFADQDWLRLFVHVANVNVRTFEVDELTRRYHGFTVSRPVDLFVFHHLR